MHKCLVIIVALIVLGLLTEDAAAGLVLLGGGHSRTEIAQACRAGGGTFSSRPGGGYGCKTAKGEVICTGTGYCVGFCETCGEQRFGSGWINTVSGALKNSAGLAR